MALRLYTGADFIKKAIQLLNVIDVTAEVPAEASAQGEDALQMMIDNWRTHRAMLFATEAHQLALAANTQSYTIGPGATWDIPRPNWIEFWSLIPDRTAAATSLQELPFVRPLTTVEWQRIPVKGTTSRYPTQLYYDEAFNATTGRATVKVYPIPTVSVADVVLYTPTPIANFADLVTGYYFPPGVVLAITTNLAKALSLYYPGSLTEEVRDAARVSFGDVKRSNWRNREVEFDAALANGGRGRRYDAYSDT